MSRRRLRSGGGVTTIPSIVAPDLLRQTVGRQRVRRLGLKSRIVTFFDPHILLACRQLKCQQLETNGLFCPRPPLVLFSYSSPLAIMSRTLVCLAGCRSWRCSIATCHTARGTVYVISFSGKCTRKEFKIIVS